MGKIFSPPKMPSTPVVTYTPAATTSEPTPITDPEPTADEVRLQNVLTRRRGRLGTIATSLSGVLSNSSTNGQNTGKTLLGE